MLQYVYKFVFKQSNLFLPCTTMESQIPEQMQLLSLQIAVFAFGYTWDIYFQQCRLCGILPYISHTEIFRSKNVYKLIHNQWIVKTTAAMVCMQMYWMTASFCVSKFGSIILPFLIHVLPSKICLAVKETISVLW